MKIETLKNATFKVTMPCGKVFGGLYKDTLLEHCHAWQQRQNELATMLAENGYTVAALNEYDYKVIAGKVFVFSHLYNDVFILNIMTQEALQQKKDIVMNIETIKQKENGTWVVVLENGKTFSGINKQDVIDFANEWADKQ